MESIQWPGRMGSTRGRDARNNEDQAGEQGSESRPGSHVAQCMASGGDEEEMKSGPGAERQGLRDAGRAFIVTYVNVACLCLFKFISTH